MIFEIWVDADSIPESLRKIILKAAVRLGTAAYFVADRELPDVKQFIAEDTHRIRVEKSDNNLKSAIKMITVPSGENSADNYIVQNIPETSLCVTHDIPLAARLLEKKCYVIDDRGGEYSSETIKTRLGDRLVNAELRSWGIFTDLQKKSTQKDVKMFADKLDAVSLRISKLPSDKQ